MGALAEQGIETRPVWGLLHEQAPFRQCTAWRVERARWFWRRVLNLPCSSDLEPDDVARVVAAIGAARRAV
jgi:perosamine synthetase